MSAADLSLAGAGRYWLRNAAVFKRTWLYSMAAWFIEPVLYLLAMGIGLGRYLERIEGVPYIEFIAPGLLGVAVMWGATFDATWNAFFKMERGRIYEATSATPVGITDIAVGEAMWATTRGAMYGFAFAGVALPFGVFHSWWALALPVPVLLTGLAFSLTGLSFSYRIKEMDYLAYYWTLFLAPMFMFAGVFFPLERMPDWVRAVAWLMPLHHSANALRGLMRGDPALAAGGIVWLLVFVTVLFALPPRTLRRRFLG